MTDSAPAFHQGPNGKIAYRLTEGDGPTAVWLGGYASDMQGTKAQKLAEAAEADGSAFLRFDYTGHGESEGAFEEGTISRWFEDAEAVIEAVAPGPKILIGSSMGGWVTLLYALRHPESVAGMVLIAPAPDFTEKLVFPRFSSEQRTTLEADGVLRTGTSGHPAETYTQGLFVDGRQNLIMGESIPVPCPVRILHGLADDVVPTSHVMELTDRIEAPSLTTTLVKGGDHRLSEPEDLERLIQTVKTLSP
ncbi:alpha/beta hydrolase [Parvularcula sp. ZS-1/3]|uniref:Palmitoyl-protein thioesterase ABHD10, mitochondrial n=1 Tax=Parvularcula mediterranea TaxID=2732508 RepID=A0A7Y3RM71_9PROT|nr:alpha/beta hydrolase [Parvularcula mediterranea]NNU16579.1 alpha/beta hydrolase [Parvularcula mediterranea]